MWICEEGMQPNADKDGCEDCEAGKYGSSGIKCEPCAAGKFGETMGSVSSDDCEQVSVVEASAKKSQLTNFFRFSAKPARGARRMLSLAPSALQV